VDSSDLVSMAGGSRIWPEQHRRYVLRQEPEERRKRREGEDGWRVWICGGERKADVWGGLVARPWCRCRTTSPCVGDGLTAAEEQLCMADSVQVLLTLKQPCLSYKNITFFYITGSNGQYQSCSPNIDLKMLLWMQVTIVHGLEVIKPEISQKHD
jgi:hypothetical protein